jgi:hypothetical protein
LPERIRPPERDDQFGLVCGLVVHGMTKPHTRTFNEVKHRKEQESRPWVGAALTFFFFWWYFLFHRNVCLPNPKEVLKYENRNNYDYKSEGGEIDVHD